MAAGTPFVSTAHYHMLYLFEMFGIKEDELEFISLQMDATAVQWENGTIDGSCKFEPR